MLRNKPFLSHNDYGFMMMMMMVYDPSTSNQALSQKVSRKCPQGVQKVSRRFPELGSTKNVPGTWCQNLVSRKGLVGVRDKDRDKDRDRDKGQGKRAAFWMII